MQPQPLTRDAAGSDERETERKGVVMATGLYFLVTSVLVVFLVGIFVCVVALAFTEMSGCEKLQKRYHEERKRFREEMKGRSEKLREMLKERKW